MSHDTLFSEYLPDVYLTDIVSLRVPVTTSDLVFLVWKAALFFTKSAKDVSRAPPVVGYSSSHIFLTRFIKNKTSIIIKKM